MSATPSKLDAGQVLPHSYDDAALALRVKGIAGSLVTEAYDYVGISYVPSGPGAGQIQTVLFKSGGSSGTTVATLTLGYDGSNNLSSVTKS